MTDQEVKQRLKDIGLHFIDASKRWPKYPTQAQNHLDAASYIIDEIWDYVYRPMGGKEE